jgi:hypothetical protein
VDARERAGVVTGRRVGLVAFLGGFVALGVVAAGPIPDVWPVRVAAAVCSRPAISTADSKRTGGEADC